MVQYPIGLVVQAPGRRSRLLALLGVLFPLKLLLGLPALVIVYVASLLGGILAWITYAVVTVTGRMPEGLENLLRKVLEWSSWSLAWLWGVTDLYPVLGSSPGPGPGEGDTERIFTLTVESAPRRSRILALLGFVSLKNLLLLPQWVVFVFVYLAAAVTAWVGFWIVLFTGRMPPGLHAFLAGTVRWNVRIGAWSWGLCDRYPPFALRD